MRRHLAESTTFSTLRSPSLNGSSARPLPLCQALTPWRENWLRRSNVVHIRGKYGSHNNCTREKEVRTWSVGCNPLIQRYPSIYTIKALLWKQWSKNTAKPVSCLFRTDTVWLYPLMLIRPSPVFACESIFAVSSLT